LNSSDIQNYYNSKNFEELTWLRKQIGHISSNFQINSNSSIAILKEKSPALIKQLIIKSTKVAANNIRLISFCSELSDDPKQILMWSHYSKGHCGIRLHFDRNLLRMGRAGCSIEEVNYSENRVNIDNPLDPLSKKSQEEYKKLLLTKSQVWNYECEYRLFLPPKECFHKGNMFFTKFNPNSLIRIDIGLNCNSEREIKKQLRREDLKHVKLFRAEIDPNKFKLNYKKIDLNDDESK
jgi:hypothetical protein